MVNIRQDTCNTRAMTISRGTTIAYLYCARGRSDRHVDVVAARRAPGLETPVESAGFACTSYILLICFRDMIFYFCHATHYYQSSRCAVCFVQTLQRAARRRRGEAGVTPPADGTRYSTRTAIDTVKGCAGDVGRETHFT